MSTYTPIATQTLSTSAPSVTFSSIPQGYTDLVMIINTGATIADDIGCQFNGDTGSNYSFTVLSGNGSSAVSGRATNATRLNFTSNAYMRTTLTQNTIINFENYSNSTTYKTVLNRANIAEGASEAIVGLWRSTSAITTIRVFCDHNAGSFVSGSTFTLYGIQVGNAAQKAQGGNIVTSDGTYVYHTFTSSGAFVPNEALSVDYLVVAGGGGGGWSQGGGGGAGGMRCTVTASGGTPGTAESALSLTAKSYPVIVGAGGAGSTLSQSFGANGGDSVFGSITSTGGGGGGTGGVTGQNGGSGGGTGGNGPGGTFGTGVTTQGFNGGTASTSAPNYGGGGGGGAGVAGGNGTSTVGANGGNGKATSISGLSVTYAGGGGGSTFAGGSPGTGGTGGGGNGGASSSGQAGFPGTANLGGGGGGSGYGPSFPGTAGNGGNGGSGIVIIRYAV
jgi:hypothetical protein